MISRHYRTRLLVPILVLWLLPLAPPGTAQVDTCLADALAMDPRGPIHIDGDGDLSAPSGILNGVCAGTSTDYQIAGKSITADPDHQNNLRGLEDPHVSIRSVTDSSLLLERITFVDLADGPEIEILDSQDITVQDIDAPDADIVVSGSSDGVRLEDLDVRSIELDASGVVELVSVTVEELIVRSGTVHVLDSTILGPVQMVGGELTIEATSLASSGGPCIEAGGTTLHLIGLTQGDTANCANGIASGTAALTVTDVEALLPPGGTMFAVSGALIEDSVLEGTHVLATAGEAVVRGNEITSQTPFILNGPGQWRVHSNVLAVDEAIAQSQGASGTFAFYNNILVEGPFTAPGALPGVDVQLSVPDPQPDDTPLGSIIGGPSLGGNAWPVAGLWDGDGDGLAEQSFADTGLGAVDTAPLVQPNVAPAVWGWADPDPADARRAIIADRPVKFYGDAIDVEDSPDLLEGRWRFDGEDPPPFMAPVNLTVEKRFTQGGLRVATFEVRDTAGAISQFDIPVYVDERNAAPEIDAVVGMNVGGTCQPLSSWVVFPGGDLCFEAQVSDSDAGVRSRLDDLYVDINGDGTIDPLDVRVAWMQEPITAPGRVGNGPYVGRPLEVLPAAGYALHDASDDGPESTLAYLDLDCNGLVDAGDLRLQGIPELFNSTSTRVRPGDADLGLALTACQPFIFAFVDETSDGHTADDTVYLVPPGSTHVIAEAVRLTGDPGIVAADDDDIGAAVQELPDARLAWHDRDADLTFFWTVGSQTIDASSGTYPLNDLGTLRLRFTAMDRGVPASISMDTAVVDVISPDAPDVAIEVSPSSTQDGKTAVRRNAEITIRDATIPPTNTPIVDQTWRIHYTGSDGPVVVDEEDEPSWRGADAISFVFDDNRIEYKVVHTVTLANDQTGSTEMDIRVLRTPPTAHVEYEPQSGIDRTVPVTFTATGSIDLGQAVAPTGPLALAAGTPVLDRDGNGRLSQGDLPLAPLADEYDALTLVSGTDLDLGLPLDPLPLHVCLRDVDGDGAPGPDEDIYIHDTACAAVTQGMLRLYSSQSLPVGLVDPLDSDMGLALVPLDDARLRDLDDGVAVAWAGTDEPTVGDLHILEGTVVRVEENGTTPYGPVTGLATRGGALVAASGPTVHESAMRLTATGVSYPSLVPLEAPGTASLLPASLVWCFVDVPFDDGNGQYDDGEAVFLGPNCDETTVNHVRLQDSREATGAPLPAGTFVGWDSVLSGVPHPDAGLPLSPLDQAQLGLVGGHVVLDINGDGTLDAGEIRLPSVAGRDPGSRVIPPTSSTNPDGDAGLTYRWECHFGCGSSTALLGQGGVIDHTFSTSGRKEIRLLIGDSDGNLVEHPIALLVQNTAPMPGVEATRLWRTDSGAPQETVIAHFTGSACSQGTCPVVEGATDRDTIRFDASPSTDADGPDADLLYEWVVPDEGVERKVNGRVLEWQFTEPGAYTILLRVRDVDSVNALEAEVAIPVLIKNAPPQADFRIATESPITLSPVLFDASASSDEGGSIVFYEWKFLVDGEWVTRHGRTASVTYPHAGTFPLQLTVFDNHQAPSPTLEGSVTIANRDPIAVASVDQPARLPPAEFTFSSQGSHDPDGAIASFEWDFGDGSVGTGATVKHAYTDRGSFTVTLRVTDDMGSTDDATVEVIVLNKPAILSIAFPSKIVAGTATEFIAATTDPEGGPVSVAWTILDSEGDEVTTLAGDSVTYTFAQWGTYTLRAVATDDAGATTKVEKQIKVRSEAPSVTLTAEPAIVELGQSVKITGTAQDADGTVVSHFLDLGDGTTLFASQAEHTYTEPGIYTIQYRATDDSKATGVAVKQIEVINPAPVIQAIQLSSQDPRVGDILLFSANVEDDDPDRLRYLWDFKDGVQDTRKNPIHTYQVTGRFAVKLTVTDAFGATDSTTLSIDILPRLGSSQDTATGQNDTMPSARQEPVLERLDKATPGAPWPLLLAALAVLRRRR